VRWGLFFSQHSFDWKSNFYKNDSGHALHRQIAEIALNYGEALKQKDQFQMGFAALSGVHDRYIQVKEHFFRQNETRSMCAFIPYPSLYPFL